MMKILATVAALLISGASQAGWLLSNSVNLGVFAVRPLQGENSPNYFGFGPDLTAGYSFWQKLDLAGYGAYIPGRQHKIHLGQENASLVLWGGQVALRFNDTVYMGLFAGKDRYHLVKQTTLKEQLLGRWEGNSLGVGVGVIFKEAKRTYWQFTLRMFNMSLLRQAPSAVPGLEARNADAVLLGVSYTFNSFYNVLEQNSIFKNVL